MTEADDLESRILESGRTFVGESREWRAQQGLRFQAEEQLFDACMRDEDLKSRLLKFILAYSHHPASGSHIFNLSPASVEPIADLWHQYMDGQRLRSLIPFKPAQTVIDYVVDPSSRSFARDFLLTKGMKVVMRAMAQKFIVADTMPKAIRKVRRAFGDNVAYMYDILGEAALSDENCRQYRDKVMGAIDHLHSRYHGQNDTYSQPLANMAIKLSALTPHFDPLDPKGTKDALIPHLLDIFRKARDTNTALYIDMEHYDVRHLTYDIFKEIMDRGEFRNYEQAGVVVQAYMKDSEEIVRDMLGWGKDHRKFNTRLVKGAYWDTEIAEKQLRGLSPNVFTKKGQTDEQFEKLTDLLLRHTDITHAAIASHSPRSMIHALELAKQYNLSSNAFEIQMLHGMGDEYTDSLVRRGVRVTKYGPVGTVQEGMKYFIRRLLENSSNQSILRRIDKDENIEGLLRKPDPSAERELTMPSLEFTNYAERDWTNPNQRTAVVTAIDKMKERRDQGNLYINGKWISTNKRIRVYNPSTLEFIGTAAHAEKKDINHAVASARNAQDGWSKIGVKKRVEYMQKAVTIIENRYYDLVARLVIESGKTIREAAGEINEMIDFFNFYSHIAPDFMAKHPLQPGLFAETNTTQAMPYGVVATIAPWNFSAAIFSGQIVAALVTGNTIVAKPSEKTPLIASDIAKILDEAGLPRGVFNLVTTDGDDRGVLINNRGVSKIAFTGSYETAKGIMTKIVAEDSTRSMIPVTAETGGVNGVIVDACSDLELAVQGVARGAFGYAGQKCSKTQRVIVHKDVYDRFVSMFVKMADGLVVGDASDPRTDVSPIIDQKQYNTILSAVRKAEESGSRKLTTRTPAAGYGNYINPVVMEITDYHSALLAQQEVFGPVVCVIPYKTIEEAVGILNSTNFGLTASIFSLNPRHIGYVVDNARVGDLYVNKPTTGSIVGRQPFGGSGMSGTGPQAGGDDYLSAFTWKKTVSTDVKSMGLPIRIC